MYHFTECDLNCKSVAQLKDVYSQIGCTLEIADKRVKANWVSALLRHQSAQIELVAVAEVIVDEQAVAQTELAQYVESQAEEIAPEITTVEITFYDHEVYALGKQIASITHDPDDFQTQRWVVMVGETEVHRAAEWAKCHNYICWHYKQGTLPAAIRVETVSPEIEIDSDCDPDFGVLYRVWNERALLGTFYQANDEKWVAQPCNIEDRPKWNTAASASLFIVSQIEKPDFNKLLDKLFDELTVIALR